MPNTCDVVQEIPGEINSINDLAHSKTKKKKTIRALKGQLPTSSL